MNAGDRKPEIPAIATQAQTGRAIAPADPIPPEFMTPAKMAEHLGVSRSWVFVQMKVYKDTNGRLGIGPRYCPTASGRKVLLRRTDGIRHMARFRV